jgi:hypothetical protein
MRHEIMAIRLLVRDGVSVGDARRYAPLPEKDALEPLLQRMEGTLAGLEQALSPGGKPAGAELASATRFALLVRLDMLADELPRNLAPESIARAYGAVPPRAADTLMQVLPRLQKLIREAASLVEKREKYP